MKTKLAGMGGAPAQTFVDDVFSTYLYTGNSSTQTITNGIDLAGKGGLVWIKDRSASSDQILSDTARGITYYLSSNNTLDQGNAAGAYVASTSSSGFSIGSAANVNASSDKFASWTFRKAAKFFDVVTYTGDGTDNRNIAHSLGCPAGMIFIKSTNQGGSNNYNWAVAHRKDGGLGVNGLSLNTVGAYSYDTFPVTSSTFNVSATQNTTTSVTNTYGYGQNQSGVTYVAYLFAHDTSPTGIIQCGSFTTDGSGNATVNLGWEAQYVLFKDINNGSDPWVIRDVMRGYSNGNFADLYPNAPWVEYKGNSSLGAPIATGFTLAANASATYIYMAIRRPNKPPTSGTQVFTPAMGLSVTNGQIYPANQVVDLFISKDVTGDSTYFQDRLRGAPQYLVGNSTAVENTSPDWRLDTNKGVNYATSRDLTNRIAWMLKRAPGFFDEVCYTGTGSATTQAHNLTVVPEFIIVKTRGVPASWRCYLASLGNTTVINLNITDAAWSIGTALWNATTPTSTVFSLGTNADVNEASYTYVAYLFATLAGICKVGSYTGNGTGQAIACGFSAGARFVLIKRTDSTGDWYTFDSARGLTSGSSPYLLLNSTAAEVTGNNGVYASTGGFTLGSTASTTTNISGASYIFLSVA